jgi:signal transduction histidine kinase
MKMGFRQRLSLFLVVTLIGLQALTAILAYGVIRENLVDQATRELEGATTAFTRQMDLLSQSVADDVTVLSLDYALRRAVAEGDMATSLSVLDNHGRRVGATRMLLIDLQGTISADTTRYDSIGTQFPFSELLEDAATQDRGTALAVLDGGIYWVVVAPVKAPVPIAFIAAGIPVDAPLLDRIRGLSATPHSLALASVDARGGWTLIGQSGGTLPRLPRANEMLDTDAVLTTEADGRLAVTTRLATAANSNPIIAILDYPISELLKAYWAVLIPILLVFSGVLVAGLLGVALIARSVSKPLEALAGAARRIASGDYSAVPEVSGKDEIGDLSRALGNMSEAIAERENSLMSAVASLEVARDEAVRANEAKAQFLSNMSHEFRTPLNAILGFSEMIQEEVLGPVGTQQYADYAGNIHESGTHLLAQLTAMLNLADASAGKTTLNRERIAPGSMISSIVDALSPMAAKSNVSVSVNGIS